MKIKIIDILNKIANGEEPPKKIVYKDDIYVYNENAGDYENGQDEYLFDEYVLTDILNDEVEILETTIHNEKEIEKTTEVLKWAEEKVFPLIKKIQEIEKQNKKIEPLKYKEIKSPIMGDVVEYDYSEKELLDKINEIIDYINKD